MLSPEELQLAVTDFETFLRLSTPERKDSWERTVARTVWELGNNPSLRILIYCPREQQINLVADGIAREIQYNPVVNVVFPHLRLNPDMSSSLQNLYVERSVICREPSVRVMLPTGSLMGCRIDLALLTEGTSIIDTEMTIRQRLTRDGRILYM